MAYRSILAAAAAILPAAAQAADYVTAVEATGPLAYWRLNADNQPSTNGLYGTTYSNVTTSPAGAGAPLASDAGNAAAVFDGAAPVSVITTGLNGGVPGTGTIVAWVNLAALPSSTGRTLAVAGIAQGGNDLDFQFGPDNVLRFYTGGGENTAYTPSLTGLTGQWHMLTATFDGRGDATTDFRNIYWDGALGASVTGEDVNGATKVNPFTIGYNAVFGDREFVGRIDEVAVWNRALTAGEIATIYASRLDAGDPGTPAVPEPATWATMMLGFALVGTAARRRRAVAAI